MKKLLIILFVISSLSIGCKEQLDEKIKVISIEEMQTLLQLDNVQLIDVRTPKEYNEGFIANAQNIDFFSPTFDEDIKKLDKQKPVLVYCKSGNRSAKCSKKLLKAGFVKIYDLKAGFSKWKHEGLEINMK